MLAVDGPDLDTFIASASAALKETAAQTMLTPDIFKTYESSVAKAADRADVTCAARGLAAKGDNQGQSALFVTTADAFRNSHELQEEIFGASSLVVRCPNLDAMLELVESLEGQLTSACTSTKPTMPTRSAFSPRSSAAPAVCW